MISVYDILGYCGGPCRGFLYCCLHLKRRSEVRFNRMTEAGWFSRSLGLQQGGYSFTFSQGERHPQGCLPVALGWSALISWTNLLVCSSAVQFLEGAGGNKPHYTAVCIGTALLSRARERETLAEVLLGCLSLWSASQCERTDPTCPDRCTDSSGFLCENVCTSLPPPPPPCLSVFLRTYFLLLSLVLLVFVHPPVHTQHNPCLFLTGSAVWEDGGEGGWHPTLQPVHGSELCVPEYLWSLSEANQWHFPQWGHEGHVRFVYIFLHHLLQI